MSDANLPATIKPSSEVARRTATEPASPMRAKEPLKASPAQKAAILITALGPETAARILGAMNESHIRQFARAISKIERIPPGLLETTIYDFLGELGDDAAIRGGAEQARSLLGKVLDDASVARIMDDMQSGAGSLWAELATCSDRVLANFLQTEHPQTSAVILSELRTDKAARILERLEPDLAQVIVLRLSRIPRIDADVMELMQDVIARNFLTALRRERSARKPADLIGSLLNNISDSVRDKFLEIIEAEKPEFAQEVIRVMFTFGDIVTRVEARDVSIIARNMDEETLLTALKAGETNYPGTVEFLLGNLSKRLSERYLEDLAAMSDVKRKVGEAAQLEVIKMIQNLAQKGELKLIELESSDD